MNVIQLPKSKSVSPYIFRLVGKAAKNAMNDNKASTTRLSLAISKMSKSDKIEAQQIRKEILAGNQGPALELTINNFVNRILQRKPIKPRAA
jgi:hypothetical protein